MSRSEPRFTKREQFPRLLSAYNSLSVSSPPLELMFVVLIAYCSKKFPLQVTPVFEERLLLVTIRKREVWISDLSSQPAGVGMVMEDAVVMPNWNLQEDLFRSNVAF